jgi:hypothetical protein
MPRQIEPFNVSSAGWTAVVPPCQCKRITVKEVLSAATVDFYVGMPDASGTGDSHPAGDVFIYEPGWDILPNPLKPAFYLKTATGSVNFDGNVQ